MHYTLLTAVSIPQSLEDKEGDQKIIGYLKELDMRLAAIPEEKQDEIRRIKRLKAEYRQYATAFARAVNEAVSQEMEPFAEEADSQYLEFVDETEELKKQYENGGTNCVLYPDGKIEEVYDSLDFRLTNGELELSAKSTKTEEDLRQMKLLPNYPYKSLYGSYLEMAEKQGCYYDEKHKAYGYYTNPNAIWDWYVLGGRWPDRFLVKNACREYIAAPMDDPIPCPEGYMWVCAARKQEIEWEVMRKWRTECRTKEFYRLKEILTSQTVPKDSYLRITDRGIEIWGELIFWEGETLDEYLRLHNADSEAIYPHAYSYLAKGEYNESYRDSDEWRQELEEFIESVPPCDVLVGIDYHI